MKKNIQEKVVTQKGASSKRTIFIIISVLIFSLAVYFFADKKQDNPSDEISSNSFAQGKALTEKHCQSCHVLPDPGLLDKDNWKKLLPEMGVSLGIQSREVKIPEDDRSFYPAHPAMAEDEWQSILAYYNAAAPASLPPQDKAGVTQQVSSFFAPLLPPETMFKTNTRVTCVRIDNSVRPARLFVYDAVSHQLFLFSKRGLLDSIYTEDAIVDIRFYNNEIFATSIGKALVIGTSTNKHGKVFPIAVNKDGKLQIKPALFEGLSRPVQVVPTDINGDGRTDFLLCEFGGLRGSLCWMENKASGKYEQHVIRNVAGSVNVYVKQNKQTNQKDLWALFAQGEEGIFYFKNKGNGTFDAKQVLRFPPTYGSTSFEMADINKDGFEDIVYTCGDNGDITGILKPYHGVYVFTNDGKDNFQQKFFYPMHGCYSVIAKDFKNTGNIDLAAIAYFTDPQKPEPFVYLKNDGNLHFTPYGPPKEINFESVLTMDAGDFNGDGKQDLIIGNSLVDPSNGVKSSPFAIMAGL
ncbi:FG-GAP and VCBS repeat-containing protein [Segetibacter sp.]|uniref:FG-GAP and VCBS repeat-containing protein n=1 Tax=Segetibacter sp. TaxID=2231182 RepID=UPI00260A431C|nr:FG-GAP and VCBS repeat-containing protein [Segetibacter sp.]MCW3081800.1 hypothetical protein [Segetibacter sp.]